MTFSRNPRPFIHGRVFALPSPPKVGAVCLNWARPELCGGRRVTCVPTAIQGGGSTARVKVCGCRPWGPQPHPASAGVGKPSMHEVAGGRAPGCGGLYGDLMPADGPAD